MSQLGEFQSHGQGGENADRGKGNISPLYQNADHPQCDPLFFVEKPVITSTLKLVGSSSRSAWDPRARTQF